MNERIVNDELMLGVKPVYSLYRYKLTFCLYKRGIYTPPGIALWVWEVSWRGSTNGGCIGKVKMIVHGFA